MSPRRFPSRFRSRLTALCRAATRFRRAQHGVAALEFALIAPAMVILFLGMSEVTVSVNTDRKLALVARTLADLTGRATTVAAADMTAIFSAGKTVMQPYSTTTAGFVVSSIVVTTSGSTVTGKVDWSCASGAGATKRAAGSAYTVPASFTTASSFVLVEAKMAYTPLLGGQFTNGILNFNETLPWPVRNGAQVVWSGTAC